MYSLLIVDDETIVRTTLATMVKWEELGFAIAGSVATGKAALKLIQTQAVDVVLTDIKMPVMDGLQLIRQLNLMTNPPIVLVLSAYNDFDLVREAFKLGALDYIVKGDIASKQLKEILEGIKQRLVVRKVAPGNRACSQKEQPSEHLRSVIRGTREADESLIDGPFCLACFEIDDFRRESARFGRNLETDLMQPLLESAGQVSRVAAKCVITAISPSRYILLYSDGENTAPMQMDSICRQVQRVWTNYMNISISVGISEVGQAPGAFHDLLQQAYTRVMLKFIFGQGGIYGKEAESLFSIDLAQKSPNASLISSFKSSHPALLFEEQHKLFTRLHSLSVADARTLALQVVFQTALMMADSGGGLWDVFIRRDETSFYKAVSHLDTIQDVNIWITNFTRRVADYFEGMQTYASVDIMEKAKRFIADHYSDPALNLANCAKYVGLTEKYFCTRFNHEVGVSFSAYLTDVRISMAKTMILKTGLKMYEVSEAVGFGSVEHFMRVFKRSTGKSPNAFRKQ